MSITLDEYKAMQRGVKAKRKMSHEEQDHQAAVIKWFDDLQSNGGIPEHYMLYANRNTHQLKTKLQQWAAKREGLRSGIPDMFLAVANGYSGLYIEMKRPGREKEKNGGLSDAQVRVIAMLQKCGYKVVVCYSASSAIDEIISYLKLQ